MEPYYYQQMNKQRQAVYHAILQGITALADEFQILLGSLIPFLVPHYNLQGSLDEGQRSLDVVCHIGEELDFGLEGLFLNIHFLLFTFKQHLGSASSDPDVYEKYD